MITAGTSPFGDPAGGERIRPPSSTVTCSASAAAPPLKRVRCSGSAVHFDALAHHPYPIGPPRRHAPNPDDVVIADMARLSKPLAAAVKAGTVLPRGHKELWATELSWDSNPPDPGGIPEHLQATYMEGAFDELWSEGVNTVIWFDIRDQLPVPNFQATLQSGIFFAGDTFQEDTKKISYTSFSFPFTAYLEEGPGAALGASPPPPGRSPSRPSTAAPGPRWPT